VQLTRYNGLPAMEILVPGTGRVGAAMAAMEAIHAAAARHRAGMDRPLL
jgi:hypothetical protein